VQCCSKHCNNVQVRKQIACYTQERALLDQQRFKPASLNCSRTRCIVHVLCYLHGNARWSMPCGTFAIVSAQLCAIVRGSRHFAKSSNKFVPSSLQLYNVIPGCLRQGDAACLNPRFGKHANDCSQAQAFVLRRRGHARATIQTGCFGS
jgi:hypothetical protein